MLLACSESSVNSRGTKSNAEEKPIMQQSLVVSCAARAASNAVRLKVQSVHCCLRHHRAVRLAAPAIQNNNFIMRSEWSMSHIAGVCVMPLRSDARHRHSGRS